MKKEKIKPLPVVKEFSNYFLRRAKKVLKLNNSEFESFHIDLHDLNSIDVWFFKKTNVIALVKFMPNGHVSDKEDIIDRRKGEPETEIATQGKPEDA